MHLSGDLVLITVVLGLLSGAADSVCQQQQSERNFLPTLTKAHDAHSLTSEQAARSYPVPDLSKLSFRKRRKPV